MTTEENAEVSPLIIFGVIAAVFANELWSLVSLVS
jgi:hypothetical protein